MRIAVAFLVAGALAPPLRGHDLFFRPDAFRVASGSTATIKVLNGTFSRSENAVTRDRLADLSLAGPNGRQALDVAAWSESEPMSTLKVTFPGSGTFVVGAAIKPRPLSLPGPEFNAYLKEEGIDHILEQRRQQGRLEAASKERYSKYLKSVVQAGDASSDAWGVVFGHEAEFVLLSDPSTRKAGDTLEVRCLVKGRPLAGYTVFAGGRRHGGDVRLPQQRLTTDADGVARVSLTSAGVWYVKLVHMEPVSEPDTEYESRWATISFAIAAPSGGR